MCDDVLDAPVPTIFRHQRMLEEELTRKKEASDGTNPEPLNFFFHPRIESTHISVGHTATVNDIVLHHFIS